MRSLGGGCDQLPQIRQDSTPVHPPSGQVTPRRRPVGGSRRSTLAAPTDKRERGPSVSVRVRRIYEPPEPDDGLRVLVDRLWRRGVSKDAAHVDEWPKGLTPSDELRRWYHGGEGSYEEFRDRYEAE